MCVVAYRCYYCFFLFKISNKVTHLARSISEEFSSGDTPRWRDDCDRDQRDLSGGGSSSGTGAGGSHSRSETTSHKSDKEKERKEKREQERDEGK